MEKDKLNGVPLPEENPIEKGIVVPVEPEQPVDKK